MPYKDPEKQKEYMRLWRAKRRADFFKDKKCVECGSIEKLELDHIDPSTKVDHKIWSWSETRRNEELSKCQILCSECHLEKTILQFIKPIKHGTTAGYRKNCKCEECLCAWSSYRANRRQQGLT